MLLKSLGLHRFCTCGLVVGVPGIKSLFLNVLQPSADTLCVFGVDLCAFAVFVCPIFEVMYLLCMSS